MGTHHVQVNRVQNVSYLLKQTWPHPTTIGSLPKRLPKPLPKSLPKSLPKLLPKFLLKLRKSCDVLQRSPQNLVNEPSPAPEDPRSARSDRTEDRLLRDEAHPRCSFGLARRLPNLRRGSGRFKSKPEFKFDSEFEPENSRLKGPAMDEFLIALCPCCDVVQRTHSRLDLRLLGHVRTARAGEIPTQHLYNIPGAPGLVPCEGSDRILVGDEYSENVGKLLFAPSPSPKEMGSSRPEMQGLCEVRGCFSMAVLHSKDLEARYAHVCRSCLMGMPLEEQARYTP